MRMDAGDWLVLALLVGVIGLFIFLVIYAASIDQVLQTGIVVDVFAPPDTPGGRVAVRIDDEIFTILTTSGAAAQVEVGQEIIITASRNLFGKIYAREF